MVPGYRGRGIGSELMRRMLTELNGLYMVDLTCDEDVRPFYERLGMKAVRGMAYRDFAAQEGRKK